MRDHPGSSVAVENPLFSLIILIGSGVAAAAAAAIAPDTTTAFMRENGPVENATVVVYVIALIVAVTARNPAFGKASAAAVSVLLFTCVAREVGLRRQLLALAGFDPTSTALSAWPNLVAGALTLALLPSVLWLAWRYWRSALDALLQGRRFAVTLLLALVCIVAAEVFDHLLKEEAGPASAAASQWRAVAFSLEETLEMMFPILLLIAAAQTDTRWFERRPRRA